MPTVRSILRELYPVALPRTADQAHGAKILRLVDEGTLPWHLIALRMDCGIGAIEKLVNIRAAGGVPIIERGRPPRRQHPMALRRQVLELRNQGVSMRELAKLLGFSMNTIYRDLRFGSTAPALLDLGIDRPADDLKKSYGSAPPS